MRVTMLLAAWIVLSAYAYAVAQGAAADDGSGMRAWTSTKGDKAEAQFIRLDGTVAYLRKADGTVVRVPLGLLSADDQKIIADLVARSSPAGEPGTLSVEEIARFKSAHQDTFGKRYTFEADFGYKALSESEKKQFAQSGKIPVRITASLFEVEKSQGKDKNKRLYGTATLYVTGSDGKIVFKEDVSLLKLCPS